MCTQMETPHGVASRQQNEKTLPSTASRHSETDSKNIPNVCKAIQGRTCCIGQLAVFKELELLKGVDQMMLTSVCDCCRGKKGLTNACIRHAKSQLDLDISHVKNWLRFMEVHYQRPSTSGDPDARESLEVSLSHTCR